MVFTVATPFALLEGKNAGRLRHYALLACARY